MQSECHRGGSRIQVTGFKEGELCCSLLMAGRTHAEAAKPSFGTMEALGSLPRWVPALPTLCWILRVLELGLEASGTLGRPALSWRCCLENRKGLGILVRGDACIQLCEVCVAPAHLGRGETLLALAGLPGDSSARAWWGEGAGWGVCAPTSHTPLTERLTAGSSSGPWGIYLSKKQVFPLHCPCTARICFAKPGGDMQCKERAASPDKLHRAGCVPVIHESISQAITTITDLPTSCCPGSVLWLQHAPSHSAYQASVGTGERWAGL